MTTQHDNLTNITKTSIMAREDAKEELTVPVLIKLSPIVPETNIVQQDKIKTSIETSDSKLECSPFLIGMNVDSQSIETLNSSDISMENPESSFATSEGLHCLITSIIEKTGQCQKDDVDVKARGKVSRQEEIKSRVILIPENVVNSFESENFTKLKKSVSFSECAQMKKAKIVFKDAISNVELQGENENVVEYEELPQISKMSFTKPNQKIENEESKELVEGKSKEIGYLFTLDQLQNFLKSSEPNPSKAKINVTDYSFEKLKNEGIVMGEDYIVHDEVKEGSSDMELNKAIYKLAIPTSVKVNNAELVYYTLQSPLESINLLAESEDEGIQALMKFESPLQELLVEAYNKSDKTSEVLKHKAEHVKKSAMKSKELQLKQNLMQENALVLENSDTCLPKEDQKHITAKSQSEALLDMATKTISVQGMGETLERTTGVEDYNNEQEIFPKKSVTATDYVKNTVMVPMFHGESYSQEKVDDLFLNVNNSELATQKMEKKLLLPHSTEESALIEESRGTHDGNKMQLTSISKKDEPQQERKCLEESIETTSEIVKKLPDLDQGQAIPNIMIPYSSTSATQQIKIESSLPFQSKDSECNIISTQTHLNQDEMKEDFKCNPVQSGLHTKDEVLKKMDETMPRSVNSKYDVCPTNNEIVLQESLMEGMLPDVNSIKTIEIESKPELQTVKLVSEPRLKEKVFFASHEEGDNKVSFC